MNIRHIILIGGLTVASLLLAACSGQGSASEQNVQTAAQTIVAQTREFENAVATSAAATVDAGAPTPAADTSESTPTDTPQPPTATPPSTEEKLAVEESLAAVPSTATPAPTPTDTPQLPTATPTEEKLVIGESDVDGDDGNDFLRGSSTSNQGRVILLPGFEPAAVTDPAIFRDRLVFQVEVFDARAGLFDGAGIRHVSFRIEPDNGSGEVVYEGKDEHPGYCVFGGQEPECKVLIFAESGNRWPGPYGGEIFNGRYLARIDIVPLDDEPTQWRWRFDVEIPGQPDYTPPAPDTARIGRIAVEDGRYVVDFQTFGFEPTVPGQHVHFLFDTVPPEEAGLPGGGPWQIYPTGPGQLNTSPFTLYTVAQRPDYAAQMCVLVANEDHSVNQNTGNCVDLPPP
jgi:hypothetical protein